MHFCYNNRKKENKTNMNTNPTMDFKKGDAQTHYFQMPTTAWTAGGLLWFAAKPAVDNDAADAAAVINKSFNDSTIVQVGDADAAEILVGYVTYRLVFNPADIINVSFESGESKKEYLGEFEFVSGTGVPESFPSDDDFIDVIIYADIKRGVA